MYIPNPISHLILVSPLHTVAVALCVPCTGGRQELNVGFKGHFEPSDSGLDHGLDFGLEYGLNSRLIFKLLASQGLGTVLGLGTTQESPQQQLADLQGNLALPNQSA